MDLELKKRICNAFPSNETVDSKIVEVNGIKYTCIEIEDIPKINNQRCKFVYGVGILDENKGYGIKEPLFYIEQDPIEYGDWYNGFRYKYDKKPYIVELTETVVAVWVEIE